MIGSRHATFIQLNVGGIQSQCVGIRPTAGGCQYIVHHKALLFTIVVDKLNLHLAIVDTLHTFDADISIQIKFVAEGLVSVSHDFRIG